MSEYVHAGMYIYMYVHIERLYDQLIPCTLTSHTLLDRVEVPLIVCHMAIQGQNFLSEKLPKTCAFVSLLVKSS